MEIQLGERRLQLGVIEGNNSLPRLENRASDVVKLAALDEVSRFLLGVGCSWWGSRYYDLALWARGNGPAGRLYFIGWSCT